MAQITDKTIKRNAAVIELVNDYLNRLEYQRHLSSHTISSYRRDLERLLDLLWETDSDQSMIDLDKLRQIDPNLIRSIAAKMHRQGLGGRSIARWLSAVRGWSSYLREKGLINIDPTEGVKAPKSPRKLPSTLEVDDIEMLMDLPADEPLAVRDKAILELFYSSGLRLAELAGLDWPDINLESGLVRVVGKGSRERILPVGRFAKQAIQDWQALYPDFFINKADLEASKAVFISQRGGRLSHRSIQYRLRHWSVRLGLNKPLHPHKLRHSFASHLLESSGALRSVQELLGHANLSTTQIYTHLDFQHLAKVYDQAHPRAKK